MNCKISFENKKIYKGEETADIVVKNSKNIKGIDCPSRLNSAAIDEFLVIFLVAAKAKGISKFKEFRRIKQERKPKIRYCSKFSKNAKN